MLKLFEQLEDFRIERNKQHTLIDIFPIAASAVLCGCNNWDEVTLF